MSSSIRRLDVTVVNRIAAGEVVQRPANALKELLENSLDAGSTSVVVTVRDGGLKMLQIQDNGHGIRREDMTIVCERFTTSKLTRFEDLLAIGTFGFRGEALASISHVAHLTITTRTADSRCAYRASYLDGKLKTDPQPCAGNQGTQILVEDLFYNMKARKQALRSPSEEFNRVAEVVSRYAIHNPGAAFTLKKQGDSSVYLRTPTNSTALDNIRIVFGGGVAKELLHCKLEDATLKLNVEGYVSNVNHNAKRFVLLLFINGRLVESPTLRKALEQIYSGYLPRGAQPFAYLSLQLAPDTVDVNVHPTKSQVHFLHEDRIVELIQKHVDSLLVDTASARTFYTQTLLPGVAANVVTSVSADNGANKSLAPKETVRTDHKEQKLDRFLIRRPADGDGASGSSSLAPACALPQPLPLRDDLQLTSVLSLRSEVESRCHQSLRQVLVEHTFVGVVTTRLSLIQHQTKLYLINHTRLASELFRQICLYQLGSCGLLQLDEKPSVKELALLGLQLPEAGWTEEDGPPEELADYVSQLLISKTVMLGDYFSIQVDDEGRLLALPLLLEQHRPPLVQIPLFVIRLATEVNWDEERACLEGVAAEVGRFYGWCRPTGPLTEEERWQAEHVLLPAFKRQLLPPSSMADDATFLQVADLPDLYKVFERC